MPPKQSSTAAQRGRPAGSKANATTSSRATAADKPSATSQGKGKGKGKQRAQPSESPEPAPRRDRDNGNDLLMDLDDNDDDDDVEVVLSDDEEPEKTIPPDLLTRILSDFFEKDGTRITKDANNAVAKYMDIFVKEAIARAAAERGAGFLEVCIISLRLNSSWEIYSWRRRRKRRKVPVWLIMLFYRLRTSKRLPPNCCWTCEGPPRL